MKRKRGNKKGKAKKVPDASIGEAPQDVDSEENSGLDENEDEAGTEMEVETLSPTGINQTAKQETIDTEALVKKPAENLVYGRMKVKIKTSKTLESQLGSSDAYTQSDTDRSSLQVGLEKQGAVSEKTEDSANSLPDITTAISGHPPKKGGSIKIKSSRSLGSSVMNPCTSATILHADKLRQKEASVDRHLRHSEQDLNTALEVIRKIMKMEAAEPFNAPVDPVALGIPDYFDVIDTPMDFGTICKNLESRSKYMSSKDVFKDVQFIWSNCFKYNNKGDYVVELLKRVKKNFAKYWTAAGLYSDQSHGTSVLDITDAKDGPPSSTAKTPMKGGQSKAKAGKRHGFKKHKEDCLCAICVMIRRRKEREESTRILDPDQGKSDSHLAQEELSPMGSPYTSSNVDTPLGPNTDAGEEEKMEMDYQLHNPPLLRGEEGEELEEEEEEGEEEEEEEREENHQVRGEGGSDEHSPSSYRSKDEQDMQDLRPPHTTEHVEIDLTRETTPMHAEKETTLVEQQAEKEKKKKHRREMIEKLRRFENPNMLELCGILFPKNPRSVWNGPHSLVRQKESSSAASNPIDDAISSFMR
ncbi:bromodomain testis-specific protein [Impatiens glandulifera]|uniref:bromodomain testis-specific protein n=1 Tax=Impatiens glandulifera TaxID=253017 RepID=UPI001FB09309|nr:bromodomain testis-specific protein [Impatiens glandulifera]XP_047335241.1 bromodomain testis-specific protein [Impatiens glandulifera]XP_047335242.1 bromodomain testis-specific protein [Impatiens glandulifera]